MRTLLLVLIALSLATVSFAQSFVIGLIPEQNVFKQRERYAPIGKYLSIKLGKDVRFSVLSRYGNILETFSNEQFDAAFWGSFTGGLAIRQLGAIPIARSAGAKRAGHFERSN